MDYLTVRSQEGYSSRHDLSGDQVRIGRSVDNEIILPDPYTSTHHAMLERSEEGWVLRDLGGRNGTLVNGQRVVAPQPVMDGDRILVGRTSLCFNGELATPVPMVESDPIGSGSISFPVDRITPNPGAIPEVITSAVTGPRVSGAAANLSPGALRIILEADRELVFHRPLDEILEKIMDLIHRGVTFERGVLALDQGGRLVARVVRSPGGHAPFSISSTIARRVIAQKEAVLTSDALEDPRFRDGHSVQGQHIRSVLCVPLWNQKDVIGIIYVDSPRVPGRFRAEDLVLMTHLAAVAAVKIEQHRLFEQAVEARAMAEELRHASEIQKYLLPAAPPVIPGYRLAASSVPCRSVGGDMYDFLPVPGGRWILGLGDVSGKSLPAALLMCIFQASLRATAPLDLAPDETMARLNGLLHAQVPPNRFVTFFLGLLDPADHSLWFVNAGHDPPMILRAGSLATRLEATGPPLGLFPDARYGISRLEMQRGDVLFCCSDGVPDAGNLAGERFGADKLGALTCRLNPASPEEMIRGVLEELERFCDGAPQEDDVTMLALERTA